MAFDFNAKDIFEMAKQIERNGVKFYEAAEKTVRARKEAFEMESLTALHKKLKPKGYSTNLPVPEYYKVRSGDTLWAISRRYKTPINTICRLNKISENSTLLNAFKWIAVTYILYLAYDL